MPEHRPAPDAPGRAVEATIERIRDTLLNDCDPERLNEIRAEFRRKIPFRLRSYAAALLILEASSGQSRGEGKRKDQRQRQDERKKTDKVAERRDEGRKAAAPKADGQKAEARRAAKAPEAEEERPRFEGQGVTIFFGMGKRQRLYPRVLLRILAENGGLAMEEIGEIRSFDNYSFADIDPLKAEGLMAALEGFAFRGRVLTVSKARKRGEPKAEEGGDIDTRNEGSLESSESAEYEADEDFDDTSDLGDDFTDRDEGEPESFEEESDGDEEEEEPRN